MGIKIAILGSASLGKSTTAHLLHRETGIELHSELESRLIKKLVNRRIIKDKSSFAPQQSLWFQNHALRIRERLSGRESFISDRAAGELWVYYQMYCVQYTSSDESSIFRDRCLNVMRKYNYIFLFPFGQIPIVDNNYRNINPDYQEKVHGKIKDMLVDFNLDYIQLQERYLTREERLKEVLSWIKN